MPVLFRGETLNIDGAMFEMTWPVLATMDAGDLVFVLLDPDSYLDSPGYKESRRWHWSEAQTGRVSAE